jgi:hypothetical protein
MAEPEKPANGLILPDGNELLTSMKEGVVRLEAIEDTFVAIQGLHTGTDLPGRLRRSIGSERYKRVLGKKCDELREQAIEGWASSPISETWLERRVAITASSSTPKLNPTKYSLELRPNISPRSGLTRYVWSGLLLVGTVVDLSIEDYGTIALANGYCKNGENSNGEEFDYASIEGVFKRANTGVAMLRLGDLYPALLVEPIKSLQ